MRVQTQDKEATEISVVYYWPGEGYGIPKKCTSRTEALAVAEEWAKDAATTNGRAIIHVLETTRRVTTVEHV